MFLFADQNLYLSIQIQKVNVDAVNHSWLDNIYKTTKNWILRNSFKMENLTIWGILPCIISFNNSVNHVTELQLKSQVQRRVL